MYVALNKYRFLYVNPPNVMDTIDFIIPFIFAHNKLTNTTQNMIAFDDFDRSTEECVCVCWFEFYVDFFYRTAHH